MKTVTVKKFELLNKLLENKSKHATDYVEAIKGFRAELVKVCNETVVKVNNLEDVNGHIIVDKPVSYEKEYNRAIKMLEMSVEENIELDAATFNQYVLDEWHWKNSFETVSAKYLIHK